MKRKMEYTHEKIGKVKIVKDFLPKPEELAFKQDNVKVTLNLSRSSVEFFKKVAEDHVPKGCLRQKPVSEGNKRSSGQLFITFFIETLIPKSRRYSRSTSSQFNHELEFQILEP